MKDELLFDILWLQNKRIVFISNQCKTVYTHSPTGH